MKIALINLPQTFEFRWQGDTSFHPPLGLCYVASVLRDIGKYSVEIIDCPVLRLDLNGLKNKLKESKPDIIGLACSAAIMFEVTTEVSRMIKGEISKDIVVVVGGHHATKEYELMINNPNIDFIMRGEAEFTLLDLVNSFMANTPLKDIKGLIYKENGKVKVNPEREIIKDLDELPLPAWDLLPDLKLYKTSFRYKRMPLIGMHTSRGCPGTCLFCPCNNTGFRYNSAEYIFKGMKYLSERFGIKEIVFSDDNFTLLNRRIEELCDLIIQNKLDITWSCYATIVGLSSNPNLIKKMAQAGCWYIFFGIESGNENVLKLNKVNKLNNFETVRKVLKECQKNGITLKGSFILGLPGDTKETIEETIAFAKSLPLDTVNFATAVPYPGTEFYNLARANGDVFDFDWNDYRKMSAHAELPIFVPQGVSREWLQKKQRLAYKEFYFRPNFILHCLGKVKNLSDFLRYKRMAWVYFKKTVVNN